MKYVVVVDEEKIVEEYLEAFLRRAGFQEASFNDRTETLDFIKINCEEIDLVIVDPTTPNMCGVRLAEELMAVVPSIPLICFAEYPAPRAEDLSNNVKIVLQKPALRKEFIDAVETVIGVA